MPRCTMGPVVLAGSGNPELAAAIAQALGVSVGSATVGRFPDDELQIELHEDVRARDVCLAQSLSPPADRTLLELIFLADAARRSGARSVVAAVPYVAYARQDKRAEGMPLGARVVAELLQAAGIDRLVALDLHSAELGAGLRIPLDHLSAVPLLADELRQDGGFTRVVVSPDAGGVARAEAYARRLQLPVAVVEKTRISGSEVSARAVAGDVRGRSPILVDDIISTGATIEAALRALRTAGCAEPATVAATHALLVGGALERLARLPIQRLVTTDSLPPPAGSAFPITRVPVAGLIAGAITRAIGRSTAPPSP